MTQFYKAIPANILVERLQTLHRDCLIIPSRIGDLAILDNERNYIGYIDFHTSELVFSKDIQE